MRGFSYRAVYLSGVDFFRGKTKVLSDISLSVGAGELVAVMGHSGCGKTTLLELASGLLFPAKGVVEVCHRNLNFCTTTELFRLRRQMGILFQTGALFSDLSVFDNVAFPLRELTFLPGDAVRDLTWMKLEAVGLRSAARMFPSELSGGMARRVALARAIALDPRVLLCDEPFSGLDPVSVSAIAALIRSITNIFRSATMVVTHNIGESIHIFDRIFLLIGGSLVFDGSSDEMLSSRNEMVKNFISGKFDKAPSRAIPSGEATLAENLRIS
ncbi:ABC transporter ATP-binding protein [Candidatus Ichthyocystis hellenicum]|uniref:ABC transporter ATP-binding protein n=1 Tax=Candidatus Ichthyocystis hellenicum TaxID=1561003 RepID=UPI000AC68509|nr:ATP-binding cassette domain-containing protein [Candidatus Ichthyocystis hellenicum]